MVSTQQQELDSANGESMPFQDALKRDGAKRKAKVQQNFDGLEKVYSRNWRTSCTWKTPSVRLSEETAIKFC